MPFQLKAAAGYRSYEWDWRGWHHHCRKSAPGKRGNLWPNCWRFASIPAFAQRHKVDQTSIGILLPMLSFFGHPDFTGLGASVLTTAGFTIQLRFRPNVRTGSVSESQGSHFRRPHMACA